MSFPTRAIANRCLFLLTVVVCPTSLFAANASATYCVPSTNRSLQVAWPSKASNKNAAPLRLREVGVKNSAIAVQMTRAIASDGTVDKNGSLVLANIPARQSDAADRQFNLEPARPDSGQPANFEFKDVTEESLGLYENGNPVFVYNHGVITCDRVPETDHRRSRACYVHPVWGLNGEILTDDFPRDHYHHHGIFWTWPHVRIGEQEYDLWAGSRIHQKFVRWLDRDTGPVAGVLGVENGWFVGDKKVMIERVWIRTYTATDTSRSIDFCLTWIPTDEPITLQGAPNKSYGGLTMRFKPPAHRGDETVITVPAGATKRDLPDTRLKWADFTTQYPNVSTVSGAALFVAPDHPDYPPTWLTRHYGPLCVGWPGVKPKTFAPGQTIRLNYRIWIHRRAVDAGELSATYAAYHHTYRSPSQGSN